MKNYMGPDDIARFREKRRKAFDQPCTKCGEAPVVIVAEDKALCSECYLTALKKMKKKLRRIDPVVGSLIE